MPDERETQRRTVLETLELGEVRRGVVSALTNFGIFVDLGGLDGLVTVANMSWTPVDRISDVAQVGQSVTVVVLDIDWDRERVSLSFRDLEPDPLAAFARSRLGEEIPGIVSEVIPPGVVVRLDTGIHGLVSAGDPALTRLAAAGRNCAKGDPLTVRVCNINLHRRQIRLRVVETPQ
ncbi:S1 RNA-binding domain-containing protein [Streptodolium elevatio]|uniref:S1 RNA-binding domain-containing protein n=1 Tax=Streptodolium elevatio TaxID=3157996 RepID=A0ABV3DL53_9ACTN